MLTLKRMKAKACRGIVDGPELPFERGGLLLCGANGTGKSSFIDGIERVLTGRCSSVETGDQSLSWTRHGTHVKCDGPPRAEVTLTDGNKDFTVALGTDPKTQPTAVRMLLEAARRDSFILRRRALLDFINAKPLERYAAVQGFLNVSEFKTFEDKLNELVGSAQSAFGVAQYSLQLLEEKLRAQLQLDRSAPMTQEACFTHLTRTLSQMKFAPVSSLHEVNKRAEELKLLLEPFKNMKQLVALEGLAQKVAEIPDAGATIEAGAAYKKDREKCLAEEAKLKGHFYEDVLKTGLRWIQEDALEDCPLCGNAVRVAEVTARVNRLLEQNREIIRLRGAQSTSRAAFVAAIQTLADSLKSVHALWPKVMGEELPAESLRIIGFLDSVTERHTSQQQPSVISEDVRTLTERGVNKRVKLLSEAVAAKKSEFPGSEKYATLHEASSHLSAVATQLPAIDVARAHARRAAVGLNQLQIMAALAEKARKHAVQEVVDRVASIADGYFQKIHPSEHIGQPRLTVTERGTASLSLTGQFYGTEGDPRGHYSEGHVDSLGLCLFLAIRRLHHTQDPSLSLLILDDVLHSIDGEHRRETANLIFEEFQDHQIIVTTHDRLWFEYLKAAATRDGKRKFKQLRIADWTIETGPIWGDHLSDHEWLVSAEGTKAQPADRVIRASRLLEEMLQHLCDGLDISVPFRIRGDYTIDPLWTSFYAAARRKNKQFLGQARSHLDDIENLRLLRNLAGAHWNEWAASLTPAEARSFADAVLALRDLSYCPTCSRFIARIAELAGVWSCKCENKRYKDA